MLTVGSLFAGIGGFDLAAQWVGWQTKWVSEIDPYASRILQQRFPEAPNLGDITKISKPPAVDIMVGGFPCQDISQAGAGSGITGERSGLWSHFARLIGEVHPRWVVIENSPMLRSRGLGVVLQDLAALGYDAEWHCIPAASVGAPHQRDRIWIIAHTTRIRYAADCVVCGECGEPWCDAHEDHYAECPCRGPDSGDLAHSLRERLEGYTWYGHRQEGRTETGGSTPSRDVPAGEHPEGWWASSSGVCRVAHGVPHRVDRLRCLGNAIVPHVAYRIFQAIADAESA